MTTLDFFAIAAIIFMSRIASEAVSVFLMFFFTILFVGGVILVIAVRSFA